MTKLSETIISQIPELYKELGTYKAVAEKLNISPSTVSRHMKQFNNLKEEKSKKESVKITDELIEKINNFFSFSLNMAETAREFNISNATVKKYLNEENLLAAAAQKEDRSKLIDYIENLFNEPISQWNLIQISKFKNKGINYKAQLLTLKYWFEIQNNPIEKAKGSIGIIPYQVSYARTYYLDKVHRHKLNQEKLRKQKENEHIIVTHTPGDYFVPPNRQKQLIDLDSLRDIDD